MNRLFRTIKEWEYWPSFMFYVPNIPYALYLAIKAGNLTFYSAVNPGIKNSGNGTESKYKTLELIPSHLVPKSVFVPRERNIKKIVHELHEQGINYPIIAKPDRGFRGMLVEKIYSDEALQEYLESYPIDIILQEFIDLPNECGIFYHRMPGSIKGHITSVTLKSNLRLSGDGFSTLKELVRADKRASVYFDIFKEINKKKWNQVVEKNQSIVLSEIGNHCKGSEFINGNHLISDKLIAVFDNLNKSIEGWDYGRVDLKYKSFKELENGLNYKILEINGVISEPTHFLDSNRASFLAALKSIRAHWKIIYLIAIKNNKKGVKYVSFFDYWKDVIGLYRYLKRIKKYIKTRSIKHNL